MSGGRIGHEANRAGHWKLDDKKQIITLITPDQLSDSGDYTIIKLSKKKMILVKESIKIFLEKGKK